MVTSVPAGRVVRPTAPQLASFRDRCAAQAGRDLSAPGDLHAFSVEQPEHFWRLFLEWADLTWSGSAEPAIVGPEVETARFFPNVRLNHAEVLLRPRGPASV